MNWARVGPGAAGINASAVAEKAPAIGVVAAYALASLVAHQRLNNVGGVDIRSATVALLQRPSTIDRLLFSHSSSVSSLPVLDRSDQLSVAAG